MHKVLQCSVRQTWTAHQNKILLERVCPCACDAFFLSSFRNPLSFQYFSIVFTCADFGSTLPLHGVEESPGALLHTNCSSFPADYERVCQVSPRDCIVTIFPPDTWRKSICAGFAINIPGLTLVLKVVTYAYKKKGVNRGTIHRSVAMRVKNHFQIYEITAS